MRRVTETWPSSSRLSTFGRTLLDYEDQVALCERALIRHCKRIPFVRVTIILDRSSANNTRGHLVRAHVNLQGCRTIRVDRNASFTYTRDWGT